MKNQKRLTVAASMAVVALLGGAIFGGTADAKKKKSKPVTVTKAVSAPIPDAIGNGVSKVQNGKLAVPLTVSKKFKGTVGRTAVTFQTTGLGVNAARDLFFKISSPDGTTVGLGGALNGQSIGPLTLQPNSAVEVCNFDPTAPPPPPPCDDPDESLNAPYVGVAGDSGLNLLNGVKGKGNWTFEVQDAGYAPPPATALTSILNSVSLQLTPQKPIV